MCKRMQAPSVGLQPLEDVLRQVRQGVGTRRLLYSMQADTNVRNALAQIPELRQERVQVGNVVTTMADLGDFVPSVVELVAQQLQPDMLQILRQIYITAVGSNLQRRGYPASHPFAQEYGVRLQNTRDAAEARRIFEEAVQLPVVGPAFVIPPRAPSPPVAEPPIEDVMRRLRDLSQRIGIHYPPPIESNIRAVLLQIDELAHDQVRIGAVTTTAADFGDIPSTVAGYLSQHILDIRYVDMLRAVYSQGITRILGRLGYDPASQIANQYAERLRQAWGATPFRQLFEEVVRLPPAPQAVAPSPEQVAPIIEEVIRQLRGRPLFQPGSSMYRPYTPAIDDFVRGVLRSVPELSGSADEAALLGDMTMFIALHLLVSGPNHADRLRNIVYSNAIVNALSVQGYRSGDPQYGQTLEERDRRLSRGEDLRTLFLQTLALPPRGPARPAPPAQPPAPAAPSTVDTPKPIGPLPAEAAQLLEERIYASSTLPTAIEQYRMDWRRLLYDTARANPGIPSEQLVTLVLQEINRRIQATETPGLRARREAADVADVQSGLLSNRCAEWTYEELEFWTRDALRRLSLQLIYGWLVKNASAAQMDVVGDPARSDPASFVTAATALIREVSKSILCELLLLADSKPPEIWMRASFHQNSLDFVHGFLPSTAVDFVRSELSDKLVPVAVVEESGAVQAVGRADTYRTVLAVIVQLYNSIFVTRSYRGYVFARILSVSQAHILDLTRPLIVIGLDGQVVASPVSTGQRRRMQAGLLVTETDPEAALLEPTRVLLEAGDLLFADNRGREVYDFIVLRGTPDARVVVIDFVPQGG